MDVVHSIGSAIRFAIIGFFSLSLLSACGTATSRAVETYPKTSAQCTDSAVKNQHIVRWKDGTTTVYKGKTREQILDEVIAPNVDEIEFAEQDQKIRIVPNPQTVSIEASVQDTEDWGQVITEASSASGQGYKGNGVIVAVIDSGVERTHPQLKDRMAINAGESGTDSQGRNKATNGVDDDGNGFVDDYSGFDFAENSGSVSDGTGHGTHVAGIVAADPAKGSIKGIAPQAKILALDFMADDGSGNISDAIRAIHYAASRGAKVINASWGGAPCSQSLKSAIEEVGEQGVVFVSASGNSGVNLEQEPEYPAAYGIPTQVTVGASTTRDYMAIFSNYSFALVNLVAPGSGIWSTYPGNSTYKMSGTSMAAPFVAGTAAVLLSARPNATPEQIKSALLASVDSGPFEVETRGRLNIRKALTEILKLP